jgi:hypothetical protein
MELALIGLALIVIVVFVIPLAVLRAGIRRQHRAASLTCEPRSVSAALTPPRRRPVRAEAGHQ